MERLNRRLGDAEAELAPPGEVLAIERPGDIERDAAIQPMIRQAKLQPSDLGKSVANENKFKRAQRLLVCPSACCAEEVFPWLRC